MSASSSAPLLAEFETPDALVRALRLVRGDGHRPLDAYTPFPLEELSGALPPARNPVRFVMAVAGPPRCTGCNGTARSWITR